MDHARFDRLSKFVAQAATRRAALRALAAGTVGVGMLGAVAGPLADEAAAKKKKKRTICHCGNGNPQNCQTVRKKKKTAKKHLKNHCDYKGSCRASVVNPCEPGTDCLGVIDTEGDVQRESDGSFTLHADPGGAFGAIGFGVPNNKTFADLATMESDFFFSEGSCGVGTPRFCTVFANRDDCACAQFPTTLCDTEDEGTTGNLIDNNTPGVWFRLCADGPDIDTYDEALDEYGDEVIASIFLVADNSNGTQTVNVDPCITLV